MSEIQVIKKPEWVTYEDIHDLLYLAHSQNRKEGFHVKTAEMDGDELEKHIGDGQCFIALDGNKLVGVTAVRVIERHKWYAHGRIADQILVAVHPDYKGKHISTMLHREVEKYSKENSLAQIELRTAADNVNMQRACIKWGFSYVDYLAFSGLDHHTVVMVKWLDGCPFSTLRLKGYYNIKKLYIAGKCKCRGTRK